MGASREGCELVWDGAGGLLVQKVEGRASSCGGRGAFLQEDNFVAAWVTCREVKNVASSECLIHGRQSSTFLQKSLPETLLGCICLCFESHSVLVKLIWERPWQNPTLSWGTRTNWKSLTVFQGATTFKVSMIQGISTSTQLVQATLRS